MRLVIDDTENYQIDNMANENGYVLYAMVGSNYDAPQQLPRRGVTFETQKEAVAFAHADAVGEDAHDAERFNSMWTTPWKKGDKS